MIVFLLLRLTGLIVSFVSICTICEERLVPSVEIFIKEYNIPEELAAVTLVAFGSASPELFLNAISAADQSSDLSLPAVLGSAIIAFGLIPSLCFIFGKNFVTKLHTWPIIREVICSNLFILAIYILQISLLSLIEWVLYFRSIHVSSKC